MIAPRERGCVERTSSHMEEKGKTERTIAAWKKVIAFEKVVVCKEMAALEEVTAQIGEAGQAKESVAPFR